MGRKILMVKVRGDGDKFTIIYNIYSFPINNMQKCTNEIKLLNIVACKKKKKKISSSVVLSFSISAVHYWYIRISKVFDCFTFPVKNRTKKIELLIKMITSSSVALSISISVVHLFIYSRRVTYQIECFFETQ